MNLLAFCTGTSRVYIFSIVPLETQDNQSIKNNLFWLDLPLNNSFPILNLKWNDDGNKLCLIGRDKFSISELNFK